MLKEKVLNYNGNSSFMASLRGQLEKKGELSPKQWKCAETFFSQPKPVFEKENFDIIEIKRWLAKSLAEQKGLPFFFRNLKVKEVKAASRKAILASVEFYSNPAMNCHCCGRDLDNAISRAVGVGPVCLKKYFNIKKPTIENAREILEKIDQEAKNAGTIGPIWIPRSQFVTVDNLN